MDSQGSQEWQQAFDSGDVKIRACLQHATDLLGAARCVRAIGLAGITYHLATLSLEEVGKTVLIGMASTPFTGDEARERAKRDWDDHVVKLFWALWGPSFGREKITAEQMESYKGLAKGVHEIRLASLYFPWIGDDVQNLTKPATMSEADNMIGLAEAAIGMAPVGERRLDTVTVDLMHWFSDAVHDPEKGNWIFSSQSMAKLVELGGIRPWVRWAKDQFDQADAEFQNYLSRELVRERPGEPEASDPKWQLKVRLFSGSHSVRQKPLSWWNSGVERMQLYAAGRGRKRNQLLVHLTLPKSVSVRGVYQTARAQTQRLILALNIGSMGFFWYYLPEHVKHFYEKLTDLQEELHQFEIGNSPSLVLDWGKTVVSEKDLSNSALCLGMIPMPFDDMFEPFHLYERGLVLLAKNDIHFRCEPHAYHQFYLALKAGMRVYGDWDGTSAFDLSFNSIMGDVLPDDEKRRKCLDLGEGFQEPGSVPEGISLAEVRMIKTLADIYFLRTFRRLAREDSGPQTQE